MGTVGRDQGGGAGSVNAHAGALQPKGIGQPATLIRCTIACRSRNFSWDCYHYLTSVDSFVLGSVHWALPRHWWHLLHVTVKQLLLLLQTGFVERK